MTKNTRQDLATAGALVRLLFFATLFLAIGCADSPAAPTPTAVAVEPSRSRGATESAPSSYLGDTGSIPVGISNIAPETLTLTVNPDGVRDRVRASIGGIVGVTFYPGPQREDAAEPTERPRRADPLPSGATGPYRGLVGARGSAPSRPASAAAVTASMFGCGWSTTGRRITHAGNAWAADGGSDYQVCAP